MIKNLFFIPLVALLLASCTGDEPAILVFSSTKGFRHESIEPGKIALIKLGAEMAFRVDTTENATDINEDNLKRYRAVVFLSTTGDVLNQQQQNDFMRFIQAGGGYLGIHAAADTEYEWWWYGKLVGAYFKSHPEQQEAVLRRTGDLPAVGDSLPKDWKRWDEWYNYKKISPDIKVVYNLEESSYKGGENGENHPIIWYHDYDGGRSFYIGIGHTNESYSDKLFLDAVRQGLQYAAGDKKPDYSKARTVRAPEANRFTKVVLKYFLDEPTEMTVLPDGRIIFIERKGNVKMYDPKTDSLSVINTFNVWSKSEDGMIGLTKDPGFDSNHWLYVFYSHPSESVNRLSRFEFRDGKIDMNTEKKLLDVAVQRQTCCHTGGSLAFGADGNLFISTGDNTNPFESDGYSPSDERPGREPFDALSSSSNTNDLRGKILRIHPEPDGTYTIPEGNLFPKGTEKTRPEIYTMGHRNPYRISVDQRRGWVYWGEVGPDAGNDSETRGPRGYDEMNLATGPGYFGWPLFIGGNYPYARYDFTKKTVSPGQDPRAPKNYSAHNTGIVDLPALARPFIWYPYDASPDFPLMKDGGRNAMAGPVYYADQYASKEGAFPDYLSGKLIIYEWMRGWIRLVTLNEDASIFDIEPFMDDVEFSNPMDMEFGPDGKLYMLEYGKTWFAQNEDARLVRIDWNAGNRPPVASLNADRRAGALPLSVQFDAAASTDPDGGKLTYDLVIGDQKLTSTDGKFSFKFEKPGVYRPMLTVTDEAGTSAESEVVVIAGNSTPNVSVSVSGNESYFFKGKSTSYKVAVTDPEDGSTDKGTIAGDAVTVSVDFMEEGYDKTIIAQGHQKPGHPGQVLIAESDCKSCHMVDKRSAGPAYREVAKRYKGQPGAVENLAAKIIKGGTGVWGDVAMAAHPQITPEKAASMVTYILSLADEAQGSKGLTGTVKFEKASTKPFNTKSAYLISASYEDAGSNGLPPLNSTTTLALRAPYLTGDDELVLNGPTVEALPQVGKGFRSIHDGGSVTFKNVDLRGVSSISVNTVLIAAQMANGSADIFLGGKEGKKLGTVSFIGAPGMQVQAGIFMHSGKITFPVQSSKSDVTLVFRNPAAGDKDLFIYLNSELGN